MQGLRCLEISRPQRTFNKQKKHEASLHCDTLNRNSRTITSRRLPNVWMGRNSERVHASASVTGPTATQTVQPQTAVESSFGPAGVWYFAYGSNMNPNTLKGRRQVNPLESRPAVLHGWKLSFRMLGLPYIEPGFGTIERVNGTEGGSAAAPWSRAAASSPSESGSSSRRWESEVHGVLHRISVKDWTQVMASEGVGAGKSGYRVVEVEVALYDGRRVRALTLEGQPPSLHSPSRPVAPSARYLNLLRDGARHYGVDPEYITYLDLLPSYDGSGWSAAVGRAAALAVAVPLALPLLPPVFLLRMARNRAREPNTTQAADGGGGGSDGAGGGAVADRSSAAEAASNAASTSAVEPLNVRGAAATAATQPAAATVTAATQPAAATVTAAMSVTSASTRGSAPPLDGGGGELPPQLLRPPLVLPAVASSYIRAVQYATWAVHDVLVATLPGSGSSSGAGGSNDKAQR
ncbi:hypothetical protein PLESTB_000856700 [Pleodorina starrii]|uniref:gamma-glutamylcyclotransferase n=1 Tax=Pleodorina starrii TaxID=330485 RepID=A0A9W6BLB1_9CHLO|nr:hypothetical protein PLESTM_001437100 [Pleodorina starrii]GLC54371.1 hypothetical protein PLESTB_000856700 [Pleodorina starrii]GLC72022.1 hypothetical protein PLESTF_001195900 [Pleodorina starrii]